MWVQVGTLAIQRPLSAAEGARVETTAHPGPELGAQERPGPCPRPCCPGWAPHCPLRVAGAPAGRMVTYLPDLRRSTVRVTRGGRRNPLVRHEGVPALGPSTQEPARGLGRFLARGAQTSPSVSVLNQRRGPTGCRGQLTGPLKVGEGPAAAPARVPAPVELRALGLPRWARVGVAWLCVPLPQSHFTEVLYSSIIQRRLLGLYWSRPGLSTSDAAANRPVPAAWSSGVGGGGWRAGEQALLGRTDGDMCRAGQGCGSCRLLRAQGRWRQQGRECQAEGMATAKASGCWGSAAQSGGSVGYVLGTGLGQSHGRAQRWAPLSGQYA